MKSYRKNKDIKKYKKTSKIIRSSNKLKMRNKSYLKNKKKNTKKNSKKHNKKDNRKHNKKYRLKGGGIIPQNLINLFRGSQDIGHDFYRNFTGDQPAWSNSDLTDQSLSDTKSDNKYPDIALFSEKSDLLINRLLGF